jgi:4-amino-4-deoxy-L-arabinose transferase-like glycosyltransferase
MSADSAQSRTTAASSGDERYFAWGLALIGAAGLAIRFVYVLANRADINFGGDAYFYHTGANLFVHGHGFIQPYLYNHDHMVVQAADHPPGYLVFLAVPSALGMTSSLTHLLWSCVLGTGTVVLVGLLGRAAVGPRVGLLAATIAAVYPNIWIPDGSLQAETAAMFTTALALLLAYHYLQRPSLLRLVALGAACGAASLTRSELILLLPLLVVPIALVKGPETRRRQLQWLGASVLASLVVIAPWVGYNLTRFHHPVYLSSQFEVLLASANCDTTYHGDLLGYFSIECAAAIAQSHHLRGDQSDEAIVYRRAAIDYVLDHKERVPVVVAARVGRMLGVYRPHQQLKVDEFLDLREEWIARTALYSFYALALLSVAGAILLRRRRVVLFPLLAAPAAVLITVVVPYANTRFRAPAEVALAVLAAVAIDAAIGWTAQRRGRGQSERADTAPESGSRPPGTLAKETR